MRIVAAVIIVTACASPACTRATPAPPVDWTLTLQTVATPAADASAQPQLTASKDGVILSWLESAGSQTALKYSERTDTGWSEPHMVAAGSDFFVNYADVPSVVRLADRTLVAHWLREHKAPAPGYDLRLSRSTDEGKSWSAPFSPVPPGVSRLGPICRISPSPNYSSFS